MGDGRSPPPHKENTSRPQIQGYRALLFAQRLSIRCGGGLVLYLFCDLIDRSRPQRGASGQTRPTASHEGRTGHAQPTRPTDRHDVTTFPGGRGAPTPRGQLPTPRRRHDDDDDDTTQPNRDEIQRKNKRHRRFLRFKSVYLGNSLNMASIFRIFCSTLVYGFLHPVYIKV